MPAAIKNLFRKEVIEHQYRRHLGDVVLLSPTPTWIFTALVAALLVTVACFLSLGTYARAVSAGGWISPQSGEFDVRAPISGAVSKVHVSIGDRVERGDDLVEIEPSLATEGGIQGVDARLRNLAAERLEVTNRLDVIELQVAEYEQNTWRQISRLGNRFGELETQLALTVKRRVLAEKFEQLVEKLAKDGTTSREELRMRTDAVLAQRMEESRIKAELNGVRDAIAAAEDAQGRARRDGDIAASELRQKESELRRLELELSARRRLVVDATAAGKVAEVRVASGQSATEGAVIVSILPLGDALEAEVFLPTRAVGTVAVGQDVRVRLNAFPTKIFAALRGKVREVSATTTLPNALPAALKLTEPVYRARIALLENTVEVDGHVYSLQSGMTLRADILQARQPLWRVFFVD